MHYEPLSQWNDANIQALLDLARQLERELASSERERKEIEGLRAALKQAVQMASIASDWNLDEVEIDGVMVPTTALYSAWKELLEHPEREDVEK